jgi:hypothetical protein
MRTVRMEAGAPEVMFHDKPSPYQHITKIPYFPYFRRGRSVGMIDNMTSVQDALNKFTSQFAHVVNSSANGGWQGEANSLRVHDTACRFLIAALSLACMVLWLAGEWLLGFAYGAEFAAAVSIFRLLVVEASLGVLAQVTMQLYLSRDRPGLVSAIQTGTLVISLVLLLALVPRYGGLGAAIALLCGGGVRWIALLGAVRLALKLPLPRPYLNGEDWRYLRSRLRS